MILFVGRLERRKGVDTLLVAAGQLIEQGASFRLTLAGPDADPTIRETFEREARGDPERLAGVTFAGAVSDRELDRLYAEADILCLPSRYESHGVALVEGMMFGKPIVTCDSGGIGEVVEAGRTALVATPDDAGALALELARLAGDPDLRARLGTAARESFEQRFTASEVAARMQDFILEAIATQRDRRSGVSVGVGLQRLLAEALSLETEDARPLADALLEPELEQARAELSRLHEAVAAQERTLEFLARRDDTLSRIEQGGWWRLRGRILPLLRLAAKWVRRRVQPRSGELKRERPLLREPRERCAAAVGLVMGDAQPHARVREQREQVRAPDARVVERRAARVAVREGGRRRRSRARGSLSSRGQRQPVHHGGVERSSLRRSARSLRRWTVSPMSRQPVLARAELVEALERRRRSRRRRTAAADCRA